jgi:cytochrome c
MHAYKDGVRPHPVMSMMATRLSSKDITTPTAYFKDVELIGANQGG